MKTARLLACAALLLALCVNHARAGEEGSSLAFELDAVRRAWLYGDDATAAARLDALRGDNRLSGEFPRWFAFMRASLALQQGDRELALTVMQPVLDESQDARNFVRAARLCLAYDAAETALAVIRNGLQRAPESRVLLRWQAGLQWLGNDYDAARESYLDLLERDDRPQYPYLLSLSTRWSQVKPWNADKDRPTQPNAGKSRDPWGFDQEGNGEYNPEPFSSPFMPIAWYPCDLPGLDRCLDELARDTEQAKAAADSLDALLKTAREVQDQLDTLRSGDDAQRKELEKKARRARWQAVFAARIAARARLLASEWNEAEAVAQQALAVAPEDVALLDLRAQALGELGRAEEARSGPLARLRTLCGLSINSYNLYQRGPASQRADRVFMPALTLYRANPEAGLAQFELMRTGFGDTNRNQPVQPGALGLWLMLQDERQLARKLLLEASRTYGYESGKSLSQDGAFVELALVALGESAEIDADEKKVQPAAPEGEEGVEVAKVEAAHPLLRKSLRAGAVIAIIPDNRTTFRELAGVSLWGGYAGAGIVLSAARFLPGGEALVQESLYGLPARVAAEVPAAELEAFLAEEHATSQSLKQAFDTITELAQLARANDNYQARSNLSQKVGPVFGMMEARALLLRAKLLQDKPADLKALAEWLARWQPQVDLRARLQHRPGESYGLFVKARQEAGIPEVAHTGLLLEAARALARNGAPLEAARLLWLNRDAPLGHISQNRLLALAAALARKGGDETLASRCNLEAVTRAPNLEGRVETNPQALLLELPGTRADLLEFGGRQDLLAWIEHQLVPTADSSTMQTIERICPELRQARPTLVMRNTSRTGTDGIFAASMQTGSCNVILRNWYKMMISAETVPNCKRFAAWVIASDLPVSSSSHNGLGSSMDQATAWSMLHDLYTRHGANDPKAIKETERLARLLARTSTIMDEQLYYEDDW